MTRDYRTGDEPDTSPARSLRAETREIRNGRCPPPSWIHDRVAARRSRNDEYSPSWLRITPANDPPSWGSAKISPGQAALEWPGPPPLKSFPAHGPSPGVEHWCWGIACPRNPLSAGDRPTLSTWTDGTTTMDLFVTILYPGEFEDFMPSMMIDNGQILGLSQRARVDTMTDDTLDLPALEARVREILLDRYPGKDVAMEIGISADGRLRIALWPTKGGVFYNQWVYVDAAGVVTFPEPDDGMTSIGAKPWWVHRTSGMDEAMERILERVDEAVEAAQERVDNRRKALLADRPSLTPTDEQLSAARAAWTTSWDRRRLLNACAWVQLGPWFFGHRNVLHSSLDEAREDTAAMGHAATLMRAVNNARAMAADQWCADNGWPAVGVAVRALPADPTEDERIAKEVSRGLLYLPLWDVSVDPAPDSVSDGGQPRWIFEITGEFRALPVSHPGGGEANRTLICAGRYRVESVTQDGPTTRVRLSYQDRLGDSPVANPVLLEIAARIPGLTSTHMEGPKSLYGPTYKETIWLGLTGNREFEATFDSKYPDRITSTFRPDGSFDGDNFYTDSWKFAPFDGPTLASLPTGRKADLRSRRATR